MPPEAGEPPPGPEPRVQRPERGHREDGHGAVRRGLRASDYADDMRIMETDEGVIGQVESRQLDDGRLNWTLTSKLPLHDDAGTVVGLIGITREINELKQAELDLEHLATHDSLTGLPNRYLMTDRLTRVLLQAQRTDSTVGVLFIDIDDFKAFNDAHGHEFGDLLLRAFARRLVEGVRSTDTVARIGGDEFVVILEGLDQPDGATVVARNLRRTLARPMSVARRRLKITASIGIGFHPGNGTDAEALLRAADYAMYLAKKAGKDAWAVAPPDPAPVESEKSRPSAEDGVGHEPGTGTRRTSRRDLILISGSRVRRPRSRHRRRIRGRYCRLASSSASSIGSAAVQRATSGLAKSARSATSRSPDIAASIASAS